jgi:hypothetical protein
MVSRLPLYVEVAPTDKYDAWLERDGAHIPLQLCFDTTDARTARGLPPGDVDAATAQAIAMRIGAVRRTVAAANGAIAQAERAMAAVSAASVCLPSVRTREAMAAVAAAHAALERSLRTDAAAEIYNRQDAADLRRIAIDRDPRAAFSDPFPRDLPPVDAFPPFPRDL